MVVERTGVDRSASSVRQRWDTVLMLGSVRGKWSAGEDSIILDSMERGMADWEKVATLVPGRTPKQCRER